MSTAPEAIRSQVRARDTREEDWPESAQKLIPRTSKRLEMRLAMSAPEEPRAA
jgi:hypothetical protein